MGPESLSQTDAVVITAAAIAAMVLLVISINVLKRGSNGRVDPERARRILAAIDKGAPSDEHD